jgi:hypothetical protein
VILKWLQMSILLPFRSVIAVRLGREVLTPVLIFGRFRGASPRGKILGNDKQEKGNLNDVKNS